LQLKNALELNKVVTDLIEDIAKDTNEKIHITEPLQRFAETFYFFCRLIRGSMIYFVLRRS